MCCIRKNEERSRHPCGKVKETCDKTVQMSKCGGLCERRDPIKAQRAWMWSIPGSFASSEPYFVRSVAYIKPGAVHSMEDGLE